VLQELPDLATALAHQGDHDDVRRRAARHGAEERALSDARAGEEPDALTLTQRQERVEDTNARRQGLADGAARKGRRGIGVHPNESTRAKVRTSVDGPTEAVQDATEERLARLNLHRTAGRRHLVVGTDAGHGPQGHRDRHSLLEADDLAREGIAATADHDDVPHPHARHRKS
jgi:hypothetical protein